MKHDPGSIKEEIEVVPADKSEEPERLGWIIKEKIGWAVINVDALGKVNLSGDKRTRKEYVKDIDDYLEKIL